MAITSVTANRISGTSYTVTAVSGLSDPTYFWYRDGLLIAETIENFYTFALADTESVRIEVFDSASDTPEDSLPGRARIYWDAQPDANEYEVYQENTSLSGSSPALVMTVQDDGAAWHLFESDFLQDFNAYEWNVYAINAAGNSSLARTMLLTVVRRPTAPIGSYEYNDGTGVLTFTPDD